MSLWAQHYCQQAIYILVLCVFLLKDTFFNIYCWFVNTELEANSTITDAWTKLIYKVHPSLLMLRNRRQHSGTTLGDRVDPQNQQKAQTWEKRDIQQTKKRTLFVRWDKKAECRLGREQAHWVTQTFGSSMHVCEWLQKRDKQLIWRLQINLNQ